MADSEGADGRVVVEANESDLDAQAKMEGEAAARRPSSLARRRSLASLATGGTSRTRASSRSCSKSGGGERW